MTSSYYNNELCSWAREEESSAPEVPFGDWALPFSKRSDNSSLLRMDSGVICPPHTPSDETPPPPLGSQDHFRDGVFNVSARLASVAKARPSKLNESSHMLLREAR